MDVCWDGYVVLVATALERSPEFYSGLSDTVGRSTGGVLVTMVEPSPWPGGPVVAVAARRNSDGAVGPALWLGPLARATEQAALYRWLQAGPAVEPLPSELDHRAVRPAVGGQTAN